MSKVKSEEYINNVKKWVRKVLKRERYDLEFISDEWKDDSGEGSMSFGDMSISVKKGWVSIDWWSRSDGDSKEELYGILNSCGKVLNCGKVDDLFVGISCECVCVGYYDGGEKWELNDMSLWNRSDYGDSKWVERKDWSK